MNKLRLFLIMALFALAGCGKDNFAGKFPPEILFYQNADVENADFNSIVLAKGVNQFTVKARVSAPYKLKEIKVYTNLQSNPTQVLQNTYSDFQLSPNVARITSNVVNMTEDNMVTIVAKDLNNRVTSKIFVIKFTP